MMINSVYFKEIKSSIRSKKMVLIVLGYNGLLALFGLFAFYVTFEYKSSYSNTVNYADILQIYSIIAATEFGLVLFTVPALTASTISGERERQTLDILLTTQLSTVQIIIGKLASSISVMILLAFSSLPIISLVFTIGGITFYDLFKFMLLIIVTAVFLGSIGIFFSALFKKTTAATVTTYGTLLFLGLGTLAILWAATILINLHQRQIPTTTGIYPTPDVGNMIYILFINPAVTCFYLIKQQIGTGADITSFFRTFGAVPTTIQKSWFYLSLAVQLGISILLLMGAARLLNPLRKQRTRKTKNIA